MLDMLCMLCAEGSTRLQAMGVALVLAALLIVTFDEEGAAAAAQHAQHSQRDGVRKVTEELLPRAVNVVDAVASELRAAVVPLSPEALEAGPGALRSPLASAASAVSRHAAASQPGGPGWQERW